MFRPTVLTGISIASIAASYYGTPQTMDGQIYYEFLFWGGGHVIQFSYTLLMMVSWVVLVGLLLLSTTVMVKLVLAEPAATVAGPVRMM